MQTWRAILSFFVHRSQWRKHRLWVCSRLLSCWLRVLIEHRVCTISVVEWYKGCWNHAHYFERVQKDIRAILLINKTGMLINAGIALGFFTGSGDIIPFSVDLSDFCRSFMEERISTIKIYISHHVLLVNEVYKVIKKTVFLTFGAQFDTRSSSGCKLEWFASFVGS